MYIYAYVRTHARTYAYKQTNKEHNYV